jgi:hypothetical protein
MDYLKRQEIFSLRLSKNPATPLSHIGVFRLIIFGANSGRNLDGDQHRYS